MRSREISEVLNEDARIAQKAYQKNYPFVQQSKEEFLRPDELDRKTAFELSGFLDKMSSSLSQAVSAMALPAESGKLTQGISEYLSAFNRATAYVRLYGRTGKLSSREEMAIQEKFDGVKPSLEQILNAHAAGTPIPEFRAVEESYDNIINKDLRPVSFSPPIDIPAPPQQPGQPPVAPIVGPNVPRPPLPPAPAPQQAVPPARGDQPPNLAPPVEPPADVPDDLLTAWLQGNQQQRQQIGRQLRAWVATNRPDISPNGLGQRASAYLNRELNRVNNGLPSAREIYLAQLDAFNRGVAPGQVIAPQAAPPAPPEAPRQPEPADIGGFTRAELSLIRELEGNRLNVAQAQQALAGAPGNRQRREAVDVAQRKFRRAEERAVRAGVANVPYDPAFGAPKPPRVGDGAYGGVSADMAGMDDEYMDLELHHGFQDRGNWSGMMRALQSMPTNPYGAGMEMEEGGEMPIGTFGSSKRMGFIPDPDYISSSDEAEDESEDDDMYDREIAGRGQLDDDAEKIQANRLQKELKTAKGGAKNMRDMLEKLRGKIKCK
jgi:hypothetical protein